MGRYLVQLENKVEERQARRLTSVLAMDICGYSTLAEKDEAAAVRLVQIVRAVLNKVSDKYSGRVFHEAGDGFIAEFQSANDCLSAAFELSDALGKGRQKTGDASIDVRIGLHVGDVVDQPNGDLLGHGVNIASRLQQLAKQGGILASVNLVNLVSTRSDIQVFKRGPLQLKNIQQAVVGFDIARKSENVSWRSRLRGRGAGRAVAAGLAILLVGTAVLIGANLFDSRDEAIETIAADVRMPIDRRAIRSATEVLTEANMPMDAAISALLETGSFEDATTFLTTEYQDNRSTLSTAQGTNLLHQAGALAFDRDLDTAKRVYRQILAVHPSDWVAAAQLARVHLNRSEKGEASRLIAIALAEPGLSERQRLRLMIDEARIHTPPYADGAKKFAVISKAAAEAGYSDIEMLAARYAVTYEDVAIFNERTVTQEELQSFAGRMEVIIGRQQNLGLNRQLAQSYSQLGSLRMTLAEHEEALELFGKALEVNHVLQRPVQELRALSNIARVHLEVGDHDLAEGFNERAMSFADTHDLVETTYFNRALSAEIAFARGNFEDACARMFDAKKAWPADQFWPDHLAKVTEQAECSPGDHQ